MKETKTRLTLRGSFDTVVNGGFPNDPITILEYANVLDLKKAWKVEGYAVWPVNFRSGVNGATVTASLETFLSTDRNIIDATNVPIQNNAIDNRQIAWGSTLINLGAGDKAMSLQNQAIQNESFHIDPDHLIQDELNLYLRSASSSDFEGVVRRINYIVYLIEVEITPNESIIQNIKGKGQDLSS
ncbi:unnamed protein product [marine sediment metagenome]|uniref:Uncharacterized protein n=1 Tax=marine sediment metagenome TaxID=412755 RepID=X1SKM0_9ZZZZ